MRQQKALRARVLVPAAGLCTLVAAGGSVMAMVEGVKYMDGVSLVFSFISTTGFPPGPQTTGGWIVGMILFAAAAVCWLMLLAVAVANGIRTAAGEGPIQSVNHPGNGRKRIASPPVGDGQ